jgi:hypothetical protein
METGMLDGIEDRLAGMLRPVAPSKEFVHGLGNRIDSLRNTLTKARSDSWQWIVLMLAGLLSMGLLLAITRTTLYRLLREKKLNN